MKFSLIALSKTSSDSIYNMNCNCFNSFIQSALNANVEYEIILIESHSNKRYTYDSVKIITPVEEFNFHKFLNIGIEQANGDYYILSNNDVVFDIEWLAELIAVSKENPRLKSFSPYDKGSNKLSKQLIMGNNYIEGYEIQKHLTGWCIITHKTIFNKLKKLDETFNFYYADFDYALSLQKINIKHALVTKAKVKHLEKPSNKTIKPIDLKFIDKRIPKYVINEKWTWVLQDEKMIDGLIKYHEKWGSRKSIKIKLIIIDKFSRFGLGYFNRFIL